MTVDDREQSEETTETAGTDPLQFEEADLEAVERCKKEEKEDNEMVAQASLLSEQRNNEDENIAKRLRNKAAALPATTTAEVAAADAAKRDANVTANMIQTELNGALSTSNVFVKDAETLNMVLHEGLSECLDNACKEH